MTNIPKATRRAIASLKLPTKVPALLSRAQNILLAMTNNPAFPAPTPPLATVAGAIQELQLAETATLSRTKGAIATRNEKRIALVKVLQQLKSQVQATADLSVETSASVIESAGLVVRSTPVRPVRTFAVKHGAVSGSADLLTPAAARRASYEWQSSSDGGKTWLSAPTTLQSRTTIPGFTPGATVAFRYRPVTKEGEGDWSQPASLIVQ